LYTPAEVRFLKQKVPGRSYAEVRELFNARFGLALAQTQISSTISRLGLANGRDCRFRPGQISINKGRKGYCPPGSEKGWFRPGHKPLNYMPVGSKRINAEGYLEIKTAAPNKWQEKHLFIWEKAHGPVPGGHVIIFADGDKSNIRLSNLLMVSRAELAVMNRFGLISCHKELTKAGKSIADIKMLITERKRRLKKPRSKRVETQGR
jgi:hypothetical protein